MMRSLIYRHQAQPEKTDMQGIRSGIGSRRKSSRRKRHAPNQNGSQLLIEKFACQKFQLWLVTEKEVTSVKPLIQQKEAKNGKINQSYQERAYNYLYINQRLRLLLERMVQIKMDNFQKHSLAELKQYRQSEENDIHQKELQVQSKQQMLLDQINQIQEDLQQQIRQIKSQILELGKRRSLLDEIKDYYQIQQINRINLKLEGAAIRIRDILYRNGEKYINSIKMKSQMQKEKIKKKYLINRRYSIEHDLRFQREKILMKNKLKKRDRYA